MIGIDFSIIFIHFGCSGSALHSRLWFLHQRVWRVFSYFHHSPSRPLQIHPAELWVVEFSVLSLPTNHQPLCLLHISGYSWNLSFLFLLLYFPRVDGSVLLILCINIQNYLLEIVAVSSNNRWNSGSTISFKFLFSTYLLSLSFIFLLINSESSCGINELTIYWLCIAGLTNISDEISTWILVFFNLR